MYRFLLSLIVALAILPPAFADEATAPAPPSPVATEAPVSDTEIAVEESSPKTDAAHGVRYTQEQIVNLPQDQNKFYTTIIGTPGEAKFEAIKKWFTDVPELKSVKAQTHFNAIETTSIMFKERYATTVKNTPCVRVQTADGTTLFQCSGHNVPMSGEALTKAINTQCLRRWRQNRNAGPNPDTTPDTTPAPDEGDFQPDVGPDTTPLDSDDSDSDDTLTDEAYKFPWVLVLSTLTGGLFVGAGSMVVTLYRKKYLAPPPK